MPACRTNVTHILQFIEGLGSRDLKTDAEPWGFFLRGDPDYDPATVLEGVRSPVLAIFGECDQQLPTGKSAAIFEQALRKGGNPAVTIGVFAHADHGIKIADPEGFAPGYLELMTDWIREQIGSA